MHPDDPLYSQQWHLTRLGNIEKIWDEYSGAGIHVGVYDFGYHSRASRSRRQLRSPTAMSSSSGNPAQRRARSPTPRPAWNGGRRHSRRGCRTTAKASSASPGARACTSVNMLGPDQSALSAFAGPHRLLRCLPSDGELRRREPQLEHRAAIYDPLDNLERLTAFCAHQRGIRFCFGKRPQRSWHGDRAGWRQQQSRCPRLRAQCLALHA